MEQTGSQRVACYDVLRVAATFAVVALHLSAQHWADTDIYSTAWQAFNLYDSLVRWTVPVFVMISGVFFLAGTQSLRQILRKTSCVSSQPSFSGLRSMPLTHTFSTNAPCPPRSRCFSPVTTTCGFCL